MDEKMEGSLLFEMGNCSAITDSGGFNNYCVGDFIVEPALTCATAVGFQELFRSFELPWQIFGWGVVCEVFDTCNPCCLLAKSVN